LKKRKNSGQAGFGLAAEAQPEFVKVFWFFFSKKNRFRAAAFSARIKLGADPTGARAQEIEWRVTCEIICMPPLRCLRS
jgi:hypothetical protein